MREKLVTRRQFAAAIFTTLLSPQLRVLPRSAVLLAGKGAWLSILPAAAVLLALTGLINILRRQQKPGEGLADLILRLLGPVFGRVLLMLYAAWFLLYAGFILRTGAERLTATVYLQSDTDPFIVVLLILSLIAALGTLRATARTAVIFRAILLSVLAFTALASLPHVSLGNLFPLTWQDAPGIVRGALPLLSVGSVAGLFAFLNGYVEPPEKPTKWVAGNLALYSADAFLLCFETVGTFGAKLTTRLSFPFFSMVRDISLFNVAQRVEAAVIVLWLFADFMLCVLMLRCAYEALRIVFGLPKSEHMPTFDMRRGRWLYLLEAAAVFLCAHFIADSSTELTAWSDRIIPLVMDLFVFGGFSLLLLVGKLRKML